jgi:uncharacterized protein YndB with AHSA1/START domain
MKIKASISINASPGTVWEYVGQPDCWPLFHTKVRQAKLTSLQGGIVGAIYDIEFNMGGKTAPTRCEIVDLAPGRMIRVTSSVPDSHGGSAGFAVLTYELEDELRQTKVTERIEMSVAGIPWIFRPLVLLLFRFGRPSGETTLMRLKKVVER